MGGNGGQLLALRMNRKPDGIDQRHVEIWKSSDTKNGIGWDNLTLKKKKTALYNEYEGFTL